MDYRDMSGLTVKDGRLINNRPDSRTGIEKACELNRSMYEQRKVGMMTRAMVNAEMMKDIIR
tara:strand:- start:295 stop:480 length:186 start_codon:yes stop_codon:yes gene_type:complete